MKAFLTSILLVLAFTNTIPNCICRKLQQRPREFIINGTTAKAGQWPWMVRIIRKGVAPIIDCGGVLIGSNVVLSAAHCVLKGYKETQPPSDYEVIVGDFDRSVIEDIETRITVKNIIHHSHYDYRNDKYDISMLILNDHAPCAKNIRPIPLPFATKNVSIVHFPSRIPVKELSKAECFATGWGADKWVPIITFPDKLQQLSYPGLIDNERCQEMWNNRTGENRTIVDGQVCTLATRNASACHCDSGGPLVCKHHDDWYLFGLVSWGDGECGWPYMNVFADVGYYLKWIYSTLATYPEAAKGVWQSFLDCRKYQYSSDKQWPVITECHDNEDLLSLMGFYCNREGQ